MLPAAFSDSGEDAVMAKTPAAQPSLFAGAPFAFADRFLQDHAGQIISEPRTAILELIANSYDAGATKIDIIWPTEKGETFSVTDNGIGMTKAEFERRWRTLCYDRAAEQGNEVVFPKGVKGIKRTAFGRSGKGRHAPFCFADSYEIVTMKDGDSHPGSGRAGEPRARRHSRSRCSPRRRRRATARRFPPSLKGTCLPSKNFGS